MNIKEGNKYINRRVFIPSIGFGILFSLLSSYLMTFEGTYFKFFSLALIILFIASSFLLYKVLFKVFFWKSIQLQTDKYIYYHKYLYLGGDSLDKIYDLSVEQKSFINTYNQRKCSLGFQDNSIIDKVVIRRSWFTPILYLTFSIYPIVVSLGLIRDNNVFGYVLLLLIIIILYKKVVIILFGKGSKIIIDSKGIINDDQKRITWSHLFSFDIYIKPEARGNSDYGIRIVPTSGQKPFNISLLKYSIDEKELKWIINVFKERRKFFSNT